MKILLALTICVSFAQGLWPMPRVNETDIHDLKRRTVSLSSCLKSFHVMVFTSGLPHAGSDNPHSVEIQVNGRVQKMVFNNRLGNDKSRNKGDLYTISFSSFNFNDSCIQLSDIQSVSIVATGPDGWNIETIVTLVTDPQGGVQVLTADFNVNRWIDLSETDNDRQFSLALVQQGTEPLLTPVISTETSDDACPFSFTSVALASALSAIITALLATVIFVLVQVAVCKCRPKFTPAGAETGTSAGKGEGQEEMDVSERSTAIRPVVYKEMGAERDNLFKIKQNVAYITHMHTGH